jgi:hypothetical protein
MKTSTLAAAALAFAAYKYLKRQRTERATSLQGMQEEIDRDLTGTVGGKWFEPSSPQGTDPASADPPDLTRGA